MVKLYRCVAAIVGIMAVTGSATAEWTAGNPVVAAATKDPRVVGALDAVNAIDRAAVSDDHAAFAALLADDLAVNNPQNGVSVRGATAQRSAAGQISYDRYDRVIEYAGLRDGMVLLMGEEVVRPKAIAGASATVVHRRFMDLWKQAGGAWRLTARQATIIVRP
ncbi:DUF4440 domain-containing protein [Sphingomonas sp.]|uniref:DUF4440 domain-containing protein n=1 Tax=Sphingomonas sp. TaxID=28214 RepID=UPI0035BC5A04